MNDYISRETAIKKIKDYGKAAISSGQDTLDPVDDIICIAGYIEMLPAADVEPVRRWIPCSERLPEDRQDVLCWYQYFRYGNYNRLWQTYGIGFQYNGNWGGEVSTGRDTKVLFWMPLPEPPKEDKNGRT